MRARVTCQRARIPTFFSELMRPYLTGLLTALVYACTGSLPLHAQAPDSLLRTQLNVIDSATAAARRIIVTAMTPAPVTATAPVVTPPITPTTSTTGFPSTSLGFIAGDNFSRYANTTMLLANISSNIGGTGNWQTSLYTDGYNASLAQLDTTVKYNGHATLKYNQPGGIANSPALWASFPGGKTYKSIWFRAKIRFSPGFTTTGTTSAANAYKVFGWAWSGYDGSGRLEITNTTQYDFYWGVAKNGSTVGGGNHAVAGTVTTEWTDGGWYDYIIQVDYSGITGVTRVWRAKDGNTPLLCATVTGAMNNGSALPPLYTVELGLNFNQVRAASQTQAIWYGQWEVFDAATNPNPYKLSF